MRLVGVNLYYALRRPFERRDDSFDLAHGTETARIREIGSLDIDSPSAAHAVRYQPSPATLVESILQGLHLAYSDYVFVDYGSGKGRVVLAASRFPFARIVGVEFSRELHDVAVLNVDRLKPNSAIIELVCGDVLQFVPPRDPLVCYFYNPFDETVLRGVIEKLISSFLSHPRPLFAIYVEPVHARVFDEFGWGLHMHEGSVRVYTLNPDLGVRPDPAAAPG